MAKIHWHGNCQIIRKKERKKDREKERKRERKKERWKTRERQTEKRVRDRKERERMRERKKGKDREEKSKRQYNSSASFKILSKLFFYHFKQTFVTEYLTYPQVKASEYLISAQG